MKKLRLFALSSVLITAGAHASTLQLWIEPATQVVNVGDTVTFDVYANVDGPNSLKLSDAYLAISWDSSVMTNVTPSFVIEPFPWDVSYWAPGAMLNADIMDGDAKRELLGQLPPDGPVAPVGVFRDPVNKIKVTSFMFTVDVDTVGTELKLWSTLNGEATEFYRGGEIGIWDLAFEQGAYSAGSVSTVPEPATMAVLGLGAAAMLRKRRAKK